MPTRSIKRTDHHNQLVDSLVASGHYEDASDVVRAGLRLLENQASEDENKIRLLQRLAGDAFAALDQGEGIVVEGDRQLANVVRGIGRRAAKAAKSRSNGHK
jgi:antitoxin ParD1/3/4